MTIHLCKDYPFSRDVWDKILSWDNLSFLRGVYGSEYLLLSIMKFFTLLKNKKGSKQASQVGRIKAQLAKQPTRQHVF